MLPFVLRRYLQFHKCYVHITSAESPSNHRTFPHVSRISAVTDGAVAEFAAAVGESPLDDGVHSKAQRNDGQSACEYMPRL